MSITIVGGNDSMVNNYKTCCKEFRHKAKVFTQPEADMKRKIGNPDLLILFTNTVSHKMVRCALQAVSGKSSTVVRCHSSSISALKEILSEHSA